MTPEFPVPFDHAIAAVDGTGRVIWQQGQIGRIFPLASVTKVVTSLGVMVAAQRGLVRLQQPAGPPGATIAHLLAHASGLGPEGDGATVVSRVGTRRIYSNQAFEVLGGLIEHHSKVSFGSWVNQAVLSPLGIQNLSLPASAASSAVGSAADLALLVEELLEPQLLEPLYHQSYTSVAFPGLPGILPGYGMQNDNSWGLGVEIRGIKSPHWTAPGASPQTFGHFGVSGSFLWVDPQRQVGAVFVGAEPFGDWHKNNWPVLNATILAATPSR